MLTVRAVGHTTGGLGGGGGGLVAALALGADGGGFRSVGAVDGVQPAAQVVEDIVGTPPLPSTFSGTKGTGSEGPG
jgi:hypothetical protein